MQTLHPVVKPIHDGDPVEISIAYEPEWVSASMIATVADVDGDGNEPSKSTFHPMQLVEKVLSVASEKFKLRSAKQRAHKVQTARSLRSQKQSSDSEKNHITRLQDDWTNIQNIVKIDGRQRHESSAHKYEGDFESTDTTTCHFPSESIVIRFKTDHVVIGTKFNSNVSSWRSAECMYHLLSELAQNSAITQLSLSRPPRLLNINARGIVQDGAVGVESWGALGLDGTGQIVGISDTGIDENSCYFKDARLGPVGRATVKNAYFDLSRRKVVQYIDYSGSEGDYRSGHGSHVAGSIAGYCSSGDSFSSSEPNRYKGVASQAKLSVLDIGVNNAAQVPQSLPSILDFISVLTQY